MAQMRACTHVRTVFDCLTNRLVAEGFLHTQVQPGQQQATSGQLYEAVNAQLPATAGMHHMLVS